MGNTERSPDKQPHQESGNDDAYGGMDTHNLTPKELQDLRDRIYGTGEGEDSLDIFKKDLAQYWDTISEEERAEILKEFPELMGDQGQKG